MFNFAFKIILILAINPVQNLPVNDESVNEFSTEQTTETKDFPIDLENLEPSKLEYLRYVNKYLNEKLKELSNGNGSIDALDKSMHDLSSKSNETDRSKLNERSFFDKLTLALWTFEEIVKVKMASLEANGYVKSVYTKANQLKKEDICLPFILGLLSGLLCLTVLNTCKCCLRRLFGCRRYSNRRFGYSNKFKKRNPLDETHHLLINHNLSDQEI